MKNLLLKKKALFNKGSVNGTILLTLVLLVFSNLTIFAQSKRITGKVIADDGSPLAGVTVSVKGGTGGTSTAADGSYSLMAPERAVLVFSTVGYSPQEFPVGSGSTLDIRLTRSNKAMDEVIVVGYGTTRRRDLTGPSAA